jgi:hypothetical protein
MAWQVILHPEAAQELAELPGAERTSILNAIEKLAVLGDMLGAPHSSSVKGARETLRELRPRAGRSRWRALYRRVGDRFVIAAIAPEAEVDPVRFRRSVDRALSWLAPLWH